MARESKLCGKLNYNKSNEETTTNMSSLSETIKICDNLKTEVKELLVENQNKWQEDVKLILNNMSKNKATEDEKTTTKEQDTTTITNMIKDMKAEFKTQQEQNRIEMKAEFKTQLEYNNIEWEKRLEHQKKTDGDWDKRLREQDERTKTTINTMIEAVNSILNQQKISQKRKSDDTLEREEKEDEIKTSEKFEEQDSE